MRQAGEVNGISSLKMGQPRAGVNRPPALIEKSLHKFRRSGLSLAAFARQEGLSYTRLWRWLQRTRQDSDCTGRPPFQALSLNSLLGPAWAAEVVGPGGLTVRLSAQVPRELGLELAALAARL